jgi:hypothetical protein
MLKPSADGPGPGSERSFGELASQLVDDAKAYAQAEIDLTKAIAADKAMGLRAGGILLVVAAFLGMAAMNALAVAIALALATLIGPLAGGIAAFLLIGALAGLIGWIGVGKLRQAL